MKFVCAQAAVCGFCSCEVTLASAELDNLVGAYKTDNKTIKISRKANQLVAGVYGLTKRKLYASSETNFFAKDIDFEFTFQLDENGKSVGMTFRFADEEIKGKKHH